MKKVLFMLTFALILFGCSSSKTSEIAKNSKNIATIAGKEYVGAPSEKKSVPGCEGCGEPGSFKFSDKDNKVEFIWPGSDIIDSGTYTQKGNKISISSMDAETYTFTISEDYKELVDDKYKSVFRDSAYPWEK